MRWLFMLVAVVCLGTACKAKKAEQVQEAPEQAVAMSESYALVWRDGSRAAETAPVSLTAADGTGLELRALGVRGVVDDPLAFTELRMRFHNPENREREGRFEIELPPGAVVSRLSMRIGSKWQEAEMVELGAARIAYEEILHQRRDPALLEQDAGNRFRARVFPIPARSDKEIVISYTQELRHSAEPYRVPLRGLPEIDRLDVDVVVRKGQSPEHLRFDLSGVRPKHDIEVSMPNRMAAVGLRHENLALARVEIADNAEPEPVRGLTVLFDTSASRGQNLRTQVERLAEVVEGVQSSQGDDYPLSVLAFDQGVEAVYRGPASGFDGLAQGRLLARRARGASDIHAALAFVATAAEGNDRVLLVSDGIATAGATEPERLRDAAKKLGENGVRRLDVLVTGNLRDDGVLRGMVASGLERAGVVVDGGLTGEAMVGKLTHAVYADAEVSVPGARWVWPERFEAVQPGDQRLVFADLPRDVEMKVELSGVELVAETVDMRRAERPLLERARVGAEIARIQASGAWDAREKIVKLSKEHRVMSPYTALLVLETDADYQRFDMDRHALTDILVAGEDGIDLLRRSTPRDDGQEVDLREVAMRFGDLAVKSDDDEEAGGIGQRHEGEEGKMGKPTRKQKSGLYSMRGPPDAIPGMARNFDADMVARQAGIMGVMQQESGHFLASPYGGGFAVGNDDEDVWGGKVGTKVGDVPGVGGLGLVGTGRGGGGTGEGTIGLGNFGLIGKGGGGGSGQGYGLDSGGTIPENGYGRGSGAGFGGKGKRVPRVRQGKANVQGALDKDIIRRIQRAHVNEVRSCYNRGLTVDPNLVGRVRIEFEIGATGRVTSAVVGQPSGSKSGNRRIASVANCIAKATLRWRFPKPRGGGTVKVRMPWALSPDGTVAIPQLRERKIRRTFKGGGDVTAVSPYAGKFGEVMRKLKSGETSEALRLAENWHDESPSEVLALISLGEALEASGDWREAARVYGSLIDLYPSRAEMRRFAGERLERLDEHGSELALDSYRRAVAQRPDHPSSHRLYALALAKAGQHAEAFETLEKALAREYPRDRFSGVRRVLRDDLGIVAAAWKASAPELAEEIERRTRASKARVSKRRSTRFVLHWETDRSDIDLHVRRKGEHASYRHMGLESGGDLYNDVRTGYGPECFRINGRPKSGVYELEARFHERGPGGFGMGKLQILVHDGKGGLSFEERPFVIQNTGGKVDLGEYRA